MKLRRIAGFVMAIALIGSPAFADGDAKARAKEAYARGLAAHDAGDFRTAARAFADADTALPSPAALSAALDDAVNGDDVVLGSELLDRARGRAADPSSLATAQKKFNGRAAKIRLECPPATTCNALVDDRVLVNELWVLPGPHAVTTHVDADTRLHPIDVRAGETVVIRPELPAAPPPAAPAPVPAPLPAQGALSASAPPLTHRGLPPAVVYVGGAITLALVGGMIATGVVAKSKHDDFEQNGCLHTFNAACQKIHDVGLPLVVMTNVFLGTAILTGALTAVLGIGFTDWHPSAGPTAGGFSAGIRRDF